MMLKVNDAQINDAQIKKKEIHVSKREFIIATRKQESSGQGTRNRHTNLISKLIIIIFFFYTVSTLEITNERKGMP